MTAPPKFVVDLNVGRLAKWLRAMGYDALFLPAADDNGLLRVAQQEGRIILTRDRRIPERRLVASGQIQVVLVQGDHYIDQLHHLATELSLDLASEFSRCIECNQPLRALSKEQAQPRVPVFVFQTQDEFKECPACRKVYWRGTHWRNMILELAKVRGNQP